MTPGLHQAGVRLHRVAGLAEGRRLRGRRDLAGQARQAGEVPRARRPHHHPRLRRGPVGDAGLRRLRGEEALRQGRPGRHPLDVRRRRGGHVELAQYNVKATGHVAKLRKDLGLDLTRPHDVLRSGRPARSSPRSGRPAPVRPAYGSADDHSAGRTRVATSQPLDRQRDSARSRRRLGARSPTVEAPGLGPGQCVVRLSPGVRPTRRARRVAPVNPDPPRPGASSPLPASAVVEVGGVEA